MRAKNTKIIVLKIPIVKWQLRIIIYLVTILLAVISLVQVNINIVDEVFSDFIYGITGVNLCIAVYYAYTDINYIVKQIIIPVIHKYSFTNRLIKSYRFRTVFCTYIS